MITQLVIYWILVISKNYKLIAIDLGKQTKLQDPQQINVIGKLEKDHGATMFCVIEKSGETAFNFSQNSATIVETQKIVNLLNNTVNENSKFAKKKRYFIDSESKGNYSPNNKIKFLTSSLESSLCYYSDAYVLVTGNITVTGGNANTKVAFKNCTPFKECSYNYSGISGSLWQFKRDEC